MSIGVNRILLNAAILQISFTARLSNIGEACSRVLPGELDWDGPNLMHEKVGSAVTTMRGNELEPQMSVLCHFTSERYLNVIVVKANFCSAKRNLSQI